MAEEIENKEGSTENKEVTNNFNREEMLAAIKEHSKSSMKEVLAEIAANNQQQQVTVQQPENEPDVWDTILDPKINAKTAQANFRAEAAEDKVDFYSSDDWLVEVDEFLIEDDPVKRKEEKNEIRKTIEQHFNNLAKANRALPRRDILAAVLGDKLKSNRAKYEETVVNRRKKKQELDLEKAKGAVNISSGSISNFVPSDIHRMPFEKIVEEYGNMAF